MLRLSAIDVSISSSASEVFAGFRFASSGRFQTFTAEESLGAAEYTTIDDEWVNSALWDTIDASLYECLITDVSGTGAANLRFPTNEGPPPPNVDEWFGLGQTRRASLSSTSGTLEVTGTMKVREVAGPSNIRIASFSLSVTKT